jgi:hypothetical protein
MSLHFLQQEASGSDMTADKQQGHSIFWKPLGKGLMMAFVLTALTLALHHWPPPGLKALDHFFTSLVVSRLHAGNAEEDRQASQAGASGPQVQLIELGADLRALHMEARTPDAGSVVRLNGIRPLDRAAMARLLRRLADCLAPQGAQSCPRPVSPTQAPRVLAIDVDLAPLPGDSPATGEAMVAALDALRRHVHVVAIALDRSDEQARGRRNAFMKASRCTLANEPDAADRKGLYFASSRLFLRPQQGPLQYLTEPKSGEGAWFPGLGTLAQMASQPASERPVPAMATLTQYCEQAHDKARHLEEDFLAGTDTATVWAVKRMEKSYQAAYFNWPLLDGMALHFTPIAWNRDKARAPWADDVIGQIKQQGLQAPILVLTVESGGSNDKFVTPGATPRPVTGATLHALQILSIDKPLQEANLWGALADLLLGVAMVLLSCTVHALVLHHLAQAVPGFSKLLAALLALALAWGFSWLGIHLAAHLMLHYRLWFNPLYVVIGLSIHAYAEGWAGEAGGHGKATHPQLDKALCRAAQLGVLLTGACALWQAAHH